MIVCNGIVGLCLLAGGVRHREQGFPGAGRECRAVGADCADVSDDGVSKCDGQLGRPDVFSTSQLVFAAIVSLVLYGAFVFVQTIRHRDYFLSAFRG